MRGTFKGMFLFFVKQQPQAMYGFESKKNYERQRKSALINVLK
jgi:hypothetical protein